MSGVAPLNGAMSATWVDINFGPARQLMSGINYKQAWAAATETWAMDAKCEAIDTESTSEFFRVWLSCIMYGVCLMTAILVPYYLCSDRPDKEFEGEEDGPIFEDGVVEDLAEGVVPAPKPPPVPLEQEEMTDPTPNFERARAHLMATSPLDHEGNFRSVLRTKTSDISEVGGIGIELYFRLLRSMGLCFGFLSVFSLPSMIFSYHGNFMPDVGSTGVIAKTSVGNLGRMASGGLSQTDRLVIVGCQGMPLADLTKYFGWLDFCGVVFYLMFVAYYNFKFIPEIAKTDDEENITCADFAVEVSGLPARIADQPNYKAALEKHILEVLAHARMNDKVKTPSEPKVVEVALVRNFGQRLGELHHQAELKKTVAIQAAYGKEASTKRFLCCGRKTTLQTVIDKKNEKLAEQLEPEDNLEVLRAYVLLNSGDDRGRLLNSYRFANYLLGRCCQGEHLRFNGKAIRINAAPEPTNILWVNQDIPWQKRWCMKSVMIFIWFIVMLLSTGLVLATQTAAKNQGKQAGPSVLGEPACDSGIKIPASGYVCNTQVALNWTIAYARANFTNSTDDMTCFCSTKGYKTVLETSELGRDLCKSWLLDAAKTSLIGAAASGITVVINVVLQAMIMVFVDKEKHTSVSSRSGSLMIKVCISQVVNTGIIICLVNYNGFLFSGDYTDFERGWYGVVGSALALNLALNSVTPATVKTALALVARIKRCRCFTSRLKHQAELLAAYENPPFDVATRYAQVLTTSFLTLMYSPGLPILNFFAVIYCVLNFWVDKWILLRCSKRPPLYDTKMPKDCTSAMLWAGPLHVFICIAMYSHPCTFPSNPLGGNLASMASQAQGMANQQVSSAQEATWIERVTLESTWMSFVALCICGAFFGLLIVKAILGRTIGGVFGACRTACCPVREPTLPSGPAGEGGETQEVTWDRCWRHIQKIRPPASYRMDDNPEYKPLVHFLRSDLAAEREGSNP